MPNSRYASPLRYPGGKASLTPLLTNLVQATGATTYVEPFAGGAGAGLRLLLDGIVDRILINDLDFHVYAFWWTVLHRHRPLIDLIEDTPITIDEWRSQRAIYREGDKASKLKAAFAFFYLNRTSRSGIVRTSGPIGGVKQQGKWKLDARYDKASLIRRINRLNDRRSVIAVSHIDGTGLVQEWAGRADAFLYVDPPYFSQGGRLYTTTFSAQADHDRLRDALLMIGSTTPWLLSYDACDQAFTTYGGGSFSIEDTSVNRSLNHETGSRTKEMLVCAPDSVVATALRESLGKARGERADAK